MSLNQQKSYWAKLYCKGVYGIGNMPSTIVRQGKLASFGFFGQVQRNTTADCKICFREVFSRTKINECDVLTPAGTYVVPPGCQCDAEKKVNNLGQACSGISNWRFWRWDDGPDPYNGAANIANSSSNNTPAPSDIEGYAAQLCQGCQAHKVKVNTCCETIHERGKFDGTKILTGGIWDGDPRNGAVGEWEPPPNHICAGQPFEQRRRIYGCRPCSAIAEYDKATGIWWDLETKQAVGTAGPAEVGYYHWGWRGGYGKSITDALDGWNPESGTEPPTGWKASDPAGNPYAEDNPDTVIDESSHLGVCYPGTLLWGSPANYSDTDEPDCTYYADGTSSCEPPQDPCSSPGTKCSDAIPPLKFISREAPAWSKCALMVAYKAESGLFNFTLFKTYKVKYKVISLAPVQTGGFGSGFFDVPSYGAPPAPANAFYLGQLATGLFGGWGWSLLNTSSLTSRYIYIGYDLEEQSWDMQKTQGTYQWQSNQIVLDTSIYNAMQSKGVTQNGYFPAEWQVPFPSEQQIKGMAQYRVPYMMDADLQDKIQDKILATAFSVPGGFRSQWKSQIVNEATANGTGNLDNLSLSPGESTLNPIEIGKTGNISFGGNSLVKICLGELAAGFNAAAYKKVQGIRQPGSNNLLPCPEDCCCEQATCVHCNVSWEGASFAEAEFYGYANEDKLVVGASPTSRVVSEWQGQNGFSSVGLSWNAIDWNNSLTSTRLVWTQ